MRVSLSVAHELLLRADCSVERADACRNSRKQSLGTPARSFPQVDDSIVEAG